MKPLSTLSRSVLLLLFLALVAGPGVAKTVQIKDTVKKAYDVRPGGTLRLDIDHGNIEVEVGDGDRVLIELERIADADDREKAEAILERHQYAFDQDGNEITVRSRYDEDEGLLGRWRKHMRLKIRVYVRVPARFNVDFSSGAGNVAIDGVDGRIEGRTGAGNVELDGVRGLVDVTSGAGNVTVEGAVGRTRVRTGAGNIDLEGLAGAVDASTGAGNVTAEILSQPQSASTISSGAGNVTVVLGRNVGVYVDATASLGSAECEYALKVEGKWLKKSFAGEVNGGGPALKMHAGVGNVALRRD